MHPLHKLMQKKKAEGKGLSPMEKKGKEETLESLINDMMDMDGDKVKGLKKVTVASNSPKGLSKGLDKAKELIGHSPMGGLEGHEEGEDHEEHHDGMSPEEESEKHDEHEETPEEEASESPEMEEHEEESGEEEHESAHDIEAEIEKLKEKLAKLKK